MNSEEGEGAVIFVLRAALRTNVLLLQQSPAKSPSVLLYDGSRSYSVL